MAGVLVSLGIDGHPANDTMLVAGVASGVDRKGQGVSYKAYWEWWPMKQLHMDEVNKLMWTRAMRCTFSSGLRGRFLPPSFTKTCPLAKKSPLMRSLTFRKRALSAVWMRIGSSKTFKTFLDRFLPPTLVRSSSPTCGAKTERGIWHSSADAEVVDTLEFYHQDAATAKGISDTEIEINYTGPK